MTFAAPLFLLAALAALLPLLLHMINRQRAPEMPFSTLRFLRLSVQKTRRRKYIHDIALLALRMAALMLIALALAGPAIRFAQGWLAGSGGTAIALIVDNSMSMAAYDGEGSRWERTLHAARSVLDSLEPGDQVALLVPCGPRSAHYGVLFERHELVRQVLENVRPTYERADIAAALRQAEQIVRGAKAIQRAVVVVTDGQATGWENDPATTASTGSTPTDQQSTPVAILVLDTTGTRRSNAFIRDVTVQTAGPVAGTPCQAIVVVGTDDRGAQRRHLELYIDDQKIASSPDLEINAASTERHVFDFQLRTAGLHRATVRLAGDDAIALDDQWHFALNLADDIPVAVVRPDQPEIAALDDAFYLQRALEPVADGSWAIRARMLSPQRLAEISEEPFAAVFLVNLPPPDLTTAQLLDNYVARGGHVIWIPGNQTDPALLNTVNQSLAGRLIPGKLQALRQVSEEHPEGWHFGTLDAEHPVVSPLLNPPTLARSVVVERFIPIHELPDDARVVIRLDDGSPLLVERPSGQGSVWWFGTAMHTRWTTLPVRPVFLPLVSRLTFQLAGQTAVQEQIVAGEPIFLYEKTADGQARRQEVHTPTGEVIRVENELNHEGTFRDTHSIGVYEIHAERGADRSVRAVAAHYDVREATSDYLNPDAWKARLSGPGHLYCSTPDALHAALARLRQGTPLWHAFLLAVLAALVAEAYLANRISSR